MLMSFLRSVDLVCTVCGTSESAVAQVCITQLTVPSVPPPPPSPPGPPPPSPPPVVQPPCGGPGGVAELDIFAEAVCFEIAEAFAPFGNVVECADTLLPLCVRVAAAVEADSGLEVLLPFTEEICVVFVTAFCALTALGTQPIELVCSDVLTQTIAKLCGE